MRGCPSEAKRLFGNKEIIIGCEIGILEGAHAKEMLDNIPNLHLSLVDNGNYAVTISLNKIYGNIGGYANRIDFYLTDSVTASRLFEDNTFDFVYIDGDHNYPAVESDLYSWYPKVKVGGIIGGHDYDNGHIGVKQAVDNFVARHKYNLITARAPDSYDDFWFIKDERKLNVST